MAKLIDLEREEFLHEVTENWSKWEKPTTIKELAQYMIDNAFTKKAIGTLEKTPKKLLRDIIINGDEESVTDQAKKSSGGVGFGAELVDFLEDAKLFIHKKSFHPFIKKHTIRQINKQASKIEDESIFNKLGVAGLVFFGVLTVLELILPNGFKDIWSKFKEFRENRKKNKTLEAELVE